MKLISRTTAMLMSMLATPLLACDLTISSGADIQQALNTSGVSSVCLSPGTYYPSATIQLNQGQTLIGSGNTDDATIYSSSSRVITLATNSTVGNLRVIGSGNNEFGVLADGVNNVTVWGARIQSVGIALGANNSSGVSLLSNYLSGNGNPYDGIATPSHWINSSSSVTIKWGEFWGQGSGSCCGDGEIAAYNSSSVAVDSVYLNWSGAAGVYFVNCYSCSVVNSFFRHPTEFGLDIHGGGYFYASNNEVSNSGFGAAVYEVLNGSTASFTNNRLLYNSGGNCPNGVAVIGDQNAVSMSGNYVEFGNPRYDGYHDVKCAW